jgi:hypothetical protein
VLHFGDGICRRVGVHCRENLDRMGARASSNRFGDQRKRIRTGDDTMKKFLLGTAGLVALSLSAPASAADLAARPYTKAPPMIAPVYDWTGFYIGANGGWGTARNCWDLVNAAGAFLGAEGCHDSSGGTAGGQIGYRWQTGTYVVGLEAQGNWADFKGSNVSLLPGGFFTNQTRIDAFGLFTGQIGWAYNNALFYSGCNRQRRHPLGWRSRRRRRIWFCPELVGRHRIRPPVHAGPDRQLHGYDWRVLRKRPHPPGHRPRYRPRQLPLGWPGHREVLICASLQAFKLEKAGPAPAFLFVAALPSAAIATLPATNR